MLHRSNLTNASSDDDHKDIVITQHIFYILFGLWSMLGNLLVVVTVISQPRLHQKYVLTAALSSADFITGFGYFLAGCMRISSIAYDTSSSQVTALVCFLRPYNLARFAGMQLSVIISVCIAADRLVAVGFPVWYFLRQPVSKIHLITAGAAYTAVLISMSIAFVTSSAQGDQRFSSVCTSAFAVGKIYALCHYGICASIGIAAVCLYAAAISVVKFSEKCYKMPPGTLIMWRLRKMPAASVAEIGLKRQRKFTRSMGFVIIQTIVSFVIPAFADLTIVFLDYDNSQKYYSLISPWFGIMLCLSSCLPPLMYSISNRELRDGFALILNKLHLLPRVHRMASAGSQRESTSNIHTRSTLYVTDLSKLSVATM